MNSLFDDKELVGDYNACVQFRRAHRRDLVQFSRARRYNYELVHKIQVLIQYSILIPGIALLLHPKGETVIAALIYGYLWLYLDDWWGEAMAGHQHFDFFTREAAVKRLKNLYGKEWEQHNLERFSHPYPCPRCYVETQKQRGDGNF